MYYIICTIIIMVFCITALTNSNTSEREFFLPAPKAPIPKLRKTVTEYTVKDNGDGESHFGTISQLTDDKQKDMCGKAFPIPLPASYIMPKPLLYDNSDNLNAVEEIRQGYFTNKTTLAKKEMDTTADNRSYTIAHTRHLYKSTSNQTFQPTLIIPVTPFFLTNTKNESIRHASTTANQSCSLRQLRYVVSQRYKNNEWVYRRILQLKSHHEKIRG